MHTMILSASLLADSYYTLRSTDTALYRAYYYGQLVDAFKVVFDLLLRTVYC